VVEASGRWAATWIMSSWRTTAWGEVRGLWQLEHPAGAAGGRSAGDRAASDGTAASARLPAKI